MVNDGGRAQGRSSGVRPLVFDDSLTPVERYLSCMLTRRVLTELCASTFITQPGDQEHILAPTGPRDDDRLTGQQAAMHLGISRNTLLTLIKRGVVDPQQAAPFAPLQISRRALDAKVAQSLVAAPSKPTAGYPRGDVPRGNTRYSPMKHKNDTEGIVTQGSTRLEGRTPRLSPRLSSAP